MASSMLTCLVAAALAASSLGAAAQEPGPSALRVAHRARALAPGEVVVVSVGGPLPLAKVHGRAFGRDVTFFRGERAGIWRALIGIDLDVVPGVYEVEVSATAEDGRTSTARHVLEVEPKNFPTRRLTVEPRFVTPPPEVEARIAEESRLMSEVLVRVTPEHLWQGPFGAPVPGTPNSSFGKRSIFNGQPRSPHTGADYPVGTGTPVAAPAHGTVALARDLYFAGNTVIVDHGVGLFTLFAHLSRIDVSEGDAVSPGDILGLVGATGRVTGPHLHWAVRVQGARVDPLSLVAMLAE